MKPPNNLRCEYLVNPIEIDILFPRFSWILEHEQRNQSQSAYRIIVSSEKSLSSSEEGDLCDTGKVISEDHINIELIHLNSLNSTNKRMSTIYFTKNPDRKRFVSSLFSRLKNNIEGKVLIKVNLVSHNLYPTTNSIK